MCSNWNWHTRKSILYFLQCFILRNCVSLFHMKTYKELIIENIINLLSDVNVEVRKTACDTLCSAIQHGLIDESKRENLIKILKINAAKTNNLESSHGGILGLCAFVLAHPNQIPEFLPDILVFLSNQLHGANLISVNYILTYFVNLKFLILANNFRNFG